MRTRTLLIIMALFSLQYVSAQKRSKAFAITGTNGSMLWENISEVDLRTAKSSALVFNKQSSGFSLVNAETKKPLAPIIVEGYATKTIKPEPTATMVAAVAYDEAHNKLFFTPMQINELRWVDLNDKSNTIKFYSVADTKLVNGNVRDVGNQITRMCMGADGYGYALTNDAMHLIRFSTGRNVTITDLGSVVSEKNNNVINNACGGWGGDMVADTKGNLYVISSNHNLFKVNIETRVAGFITQISGIPAEHTVNGAAVDDDGMLVLGSANTADAFYKVNPADWSVAKIDNGGVKLNVSDLASSNFLFDTRANKGTPQFNDIREVYNEKIAAYPNPVSEGFVKISFDQQPKGSYAIQLVDITGRVLTTKQVNIAMNSQVESLAVDQHISQGFYMLRVMNSDKKTVLVKKLFVE
ncbi:MAG: T9SS type A sorting domain-containing protein [Sphingobacteriales bacterium]|nr:T9SS type A sorting domain-containing protein [Sphingobacteriales bacterium]MBI3720399.1 T9SS type A sorting domain-containing protein [Sphingobacteriales bacterium]